MGLKGNDACLAKVADDEPIFVLRAQDKLAIGLVRQWITEATNHGLPVESEKASEAFRLIVQMEQWQAKTGRAKWPD